MQYQKNHKNKTIIIFIILFLFVNVILGQQKENTGYLFGHVGIDDPKEEYWIPLPDAIIELKHKDKKIEIITNKAGLIDEILPKGKYYLLSVKTAKGVLLEFVDDQKKCFKINSNKEKQFNIFLEPNN